MEKLIDSDIFSQKLQKNMHELRTLTEKPIKGACNWEPLYLSLTVLKWSLECISEIQNQRL